MSKIYKVRRAFHRIYDHFLQNHEISCIFFNNDLKIISTLKNYEHNVDHSLIYHTIQNIKCSSITNFAKIIDGLEVIDNLGCELEQVSVIVTDGYHTVDDETNISLDNITTILTNRFDHAIGMGNDFDKDLLLKIGKEFHETQSDSMFNFLNQNFVKGNKITIPANTFFVSSNEYKLSDSSNQEEDTTNLICIERGKKQKTFQLQDEHVPSSHKKHYIFVIDISGSMDDCFYSRIVQNYYDDVKFFYDYTVDQPQIIQFYDKNPKVTLLQDPNDIFEETKNDEVVTLCKIIHEIESSGENRAENINSLYLSKTENGDLHRFLKRKINDILTISEQNFYLLLHNDAVPCNNFTESVVYENTNENCLICTEKKRDMLFSCCHVVSCKDCTLKILENNRIECPVCRKQIIWIRQCLFKKNEMKCITCNENMVNVIQLPCRHSYHCYHCFQKETNTDKCKICEKPIDKNLLIKII